MAVIWTRGNASWSWKFPWDSNPYVGSRSDFVTNVRNTGFKVSGAIISFPDGSKFRKATPLTKWNSSLSLGSPQLHTGTYTAPGPDKGKTLFFKSSAGGSRGDNLLNWPSCAYMVRGSSVRDAIGDPVVPQQMRNEAVTKALNNIADQKANLSEDLATWRQTVRLIKNPASELLRQLKLVHEKRSFRPFLYENYRSLLRKGPLGAAAEEYLKYVYGWKPLMQDIYGLMELAKELGAKPLLLNGRGRSSAAGSIPEFLFDEVSFASRTKFENGNETIKVNCSLWAQVDPDWQGLRTLNQCGLLNPASLLWELVSWSFVVDWFCPIGPVLSALTAPVGLNFVDGTLSVRTQATASLKNEHYGMDYAGNTSWSTRTPATAEWSYDGYSRSVLPHWPLPGFWISNDPLGLGNPDSDRAWKAMALGIASTRSLR
jgi:hypothetical protein